LFFCLCVLVSDIILIAKGGGFVDSGKCDIEKYAIENNVPIMHKDGILFLVDIIKKYHVRNILELGSGIGYSAIQMAQVTPGIKITTIEKDNERYMQAIENINAFNLASQIQCINIDAYDYDTDQRYDMIFLDAAKAQYQGLFDKFINNLTVNGFMIVDNLLFHGLVDNPERTHNRRTKDLIRKIKNFREGILTNSLYDVSYYPNIGDGVALVRCR
jgi:predicted O-methyltransferase YrrM